MARQYRQNASYSEIVEGEDGGSGEIRKGSHGNTRLPFGLCQRYGIALPSNAMPRMAWDALKRKTGMSPEDFFEKLKGGKESEDITRTANDPSASSPKGIDRIESCNNFDELNEYFDKKYGAFVGLDVRSLDYQAVHDAAKGVDFILSEFPQAKGVFYGFSTSKSGIMAAAPNGEIRYNPKYFSRGNATVSSEMEKSSKSGFHPKNNGTRECGAHEMGHILELALARKKFGRGIDEMLAWSDCTCAKEVLSEACKIAKSKTKKTYGALKGEVSRYAIYKGNGQPSECLAECVADYAANSNNAAPLSVEVWKILKRELG